MLDQDNWSHMKNTVKVLTYAERVAYDSNCFFFQAEDGIRDYKVTGVQTCALPIFADTIIAPTVATRSCKSNFETTAAKGACRNVIGRGAIQHQKRRDIARQIRLAQPSDRKSVV